MASSAQEAAETFERDFRRFLAAADALGPDASVGQWTVKAVIAHVAAWDRELRAGLEEVLTGSPVHYAGWDPDDFNEKVSAQAARGPWPDVRREAVAANSDLCSKVKAIRPEQWNRSSGHMSRRGTPMTPAVVLSYVYRGQTHYAGHAQELEDATSPTSPGRAGRSRSRPASPGRRAANR